MSATGSDWMARMNKRNNLAMTMLRRPSEVDSRSGSTSSEAQQTDSPLSPRSSHSAGTSSLGSIDELQLLEMQYKKNEAQMKANEARMRQLKAEDERMGSQIQDHMNSVMQVNEQLRSLRDLLARIDRVSKGEYGV